MTSPDPNLRSRVRPRSETNHAPTARDKLMNFQPDSHDWQRARAHALNRLINMGYDPDLAEDALNDVIIKALGKSFTSVQHLSRWLLSRARFRYIDNIRKHRRETTNDVPEIPFIPNSSLVKLRKCVDLLPDQEHDIIKDKYYTGDPKPVPDQLIAEKLGLPHTNVWLIRKRAEDQIRRCLGLDQTF